MTTLSASVALWVGLAAAAQGQTIFSDDFESGPSPQWGNERGNWAAPAGEYFAQAPTNFPPTFTSLPFALGDLELELDVKEVADGGVWLHADALGQNGVLLVTGGFASAGRGFYWHIVQNGGYQPATNFSPKLFNQGDDIHIRVTVAGDEYAVYLNNDPNPATTLSTSLFPTGRVGLYDFADPRQRFDNVILRAGLPCYPDCDGNGTLNVNDYICFQTKFALGDPYADCDGNGVRNVNDYICFQTKFALGCT